MLHAGSFGLAPSKKLGHVLSVVRLHVHGVRHSALVSHCTSDGTHAGVFISAPKPFFQITAPLLIHVFIACKAERDRVRAVLRTCLVISHAILTHVTCVMNSSCPDLL